MATATAKQLNVLFKYTRRKLWQPQVKPAPDKKQCSELITICFNWSDAVKAKDFPRAKALAAALTEEIRHWEPNFQMDELKVPGYKKQSAFGNYEKPDEDNPVTATSQNGGDPASNTDGSEADHGDGEGSGAPSGDSGGQHENTGGSDAQGSGGGEGGADANNQGDGSMNAGDGQGNDSGSGGDNAGQQQSANPDCSNCNGKGGEDGEGGEGACPECGGETPAKADADCNDCNGQGKPDSPDGCPSCGGRNPADGAWDCPECGNSNSPKSEKCESCEAERPSEGQGDNNGQQGGNCPSGENGADGDGEDGESSDTPPEDDIDPTIAKTIAKIEAGLRNFYWFGPAGTGKTTMTKLLGHILTTRDFLGYQWPVTVLSCNAGTSPSEIRGFYFPEPRASIVMQALAQPGIIVFDEFTTLDPSVAAVTNALLANGEVETSMGNIKRHEHCVIIVTSNTLGTGANREYIGNNQLDKATLDRFAGGKMYVGYSAKYESKYDRQVVDWIRQLRTVIKENGFRQVVSTRAIQVCTALKKAGLEWKHEAVFDWTPEERLTIPGWGQGSEDKHFGEGWD